MKPSPSLSPEPRLVMYRNTRGVDIGNNNDNNELAAHKIELLKEIRDLLKNRVHSEEGQRYEDVKEDEVRNDWILAASVLDRICAIAVTVIYIVGNIVLFVLFGSHSFK